MTTATSDIYSLGIVLYESATDAFVVDFDPMPKGRL